MSLEIQIKQSIVTILKSEFEIVEQLEKINLAPTRKGVEGDFTFVVFPYAGRAKKSPEQAAEIIGQALVNTLGDVTGFNVIKGFLNIELSDSAWFDKLKEAFENDDYGKNDSISSKIMVEYSSPNTNKPLHLGHLRNNFLGYSISQILRYNGAEVTMANLINDRGIHICKSMFAYQKFGNGETPESSGIKGDKLVGKYYVLFEIKFQEEYKTWLGDSIGESKYQEFLKTPAAEKVRKDNSEETLTDELMRKAFKDDFKNGYFKDFSDLGKQVQKMLLAWEAGEQNVYTLWEKLNQWVYDGFAVTYKNIGVEFDKYYYESNTYSLGKDLVEEGLKSGAFFQKEDNSVWANLEADGLDSKLILRGDGTSVYMTQDMGTADLKYKDFNVDKSIYVVGNEQDYHFQVLKLIMKKLGRSYADGIYHMSYGMVDLPNGKMKSREGTVVDADDLIGDMVETAKSRTLELGKIDGFSEDEANELYHTLGLGAIKYFILKVDPKRRMLFNPKDSIDFQGNTGPFIQYTHARIKSLIRRAEAEGVKAELNDSSVNLDAEQSTIALLAEFTKKVQEAGKLYSPAVIANYVFELCKSFNKYYGETLLFKEEDKALLPARIAFCESISKVINTGMRLLGVNVPDKM